MTDTPNMFSEAEMIERQRFLDAIKAGHMRRAKVALNMMCKVSAVRRKHGDD